MISVVMPTYNRANYIGRAIKSVLEQTHTDWELLIVDDNPQDSNPRIETEKIINSFSDSRIKYIQNEKNLGGAGSRNVGIFASQGEYITFLDDDDMYLPTKLETQLKFMIENNWEVSVMDGATYSFEDEKLISERHQRTKNGMSKEELIKVHLQYHISGTNTFMYRADFLKKIGGFVDIPSCQEYMLMQKTLDENPKFGYIPQILIRNYMHPGEQISTGPKKLIGQKTMFENKKKYFHLLSKKQRRNVICRHHGVLFFVNYKMKNYFTALKEAVMCFFSSPIAACRWLFEYRKKI